MTTILLTILMVASIIFFLVVAIFGEKFLGPKDKDNKDDEDKGDKK